MTVTGNLYANVTDQALSGNINWPSDSIKIGLLGAGYTPNLATHVHWSDVSAQEVTGTGYTAGGVALASKTHVVTAANSWATSNGLFTSGAWIASTAAVAGNVVHPISTNGYVYVCVASGTTGASAPTWPTVQGATVVDSGATWSCLGESITVWSSASPSWTSATISANFAVIYDAQSGTSSTDPLIALIQFGAAVSSTAGTYQVTVPALGWFALSPA
jgi:hypothetical protein